MRRGARGGRAGAPPRGPTDAGGPGAAARPRFIWAARRRRRVEIEIRPWERLVIRELVEYRLDEWVRQIAFGSRTSGGGIPTMQWTGGVAFSPVPLPNSDAVTAEQVRGVLHWSSVSFAIMEEYRNQIVHDHATINVIDVSANETFCELAAALRARSRYAAGGAGGGAATPPA